jgi:hypothetical protein
MLRILAMALLAALGACAATDPATLSPVLRAAPAGLTQEALASKFEAAIASAPAIHLTERAFEHGRPSLTAHSWMTRDSVRTDVYERGRRVYSMAVRDSAGEEEIPAGAVADGNAGPRHCTLALERPYWLDFGTLVSVKWMCHVGDTSGTWLASDRHVLDTLVPRLQSGELLGTADVDGRPCGVVRWGYEQAAPGHEPSLRGGFTYYIDLERGWMLRSDGFQQLGARRVDRVALYTVEPAEPPPSTFVLRPK